MRPGTESSDRVEEGSEDIGGYEDAASLEDAEDLVGDLAMQSVGSSAGEALLQDDLLFANDPASRETNLMNLQVSYWLASVCIFLQKPIQDAQLSHIVEFAIQ